MTTDTKPHTTRMCRPGRWLAEAVDVASGAVVSTVISRTRSAR